MSEPCPSGRVPARPERPTPARTRALLLRSGGCVVLFWAALLWRSPGLLLTPRLWAEEGTLYFSALQGRGVGSAVTLVVRGYYQLLTNLCHRSPGTA